MKYKIGEEEMEALVEMNNMLKHENEKLKQYKNAWEELKKISQNDDEGKITAHDFLWFLEKTIEGLEQKHKLGE